MSLPSRDQPVALITGAGRPQGIGFEVARQLAVQGWRVLLTARDADAAQARTQALREAGHAVDAAQLDVSDAESVQALHDQVLARYGRLDALVNNATGVSPYGEEAATADLAQVQLVLAATLFGSWRLSQVFLPLLRAGGQGRIVNVSSGAGSHGDLAFGLATGNAMGSGYAVAKAALNALTVKLARENPALRINAVCPGFTATFDGGAQMGARPVADGAAGVVWAATLPVGGPTGGFFRDGQVLPW